MASLPDEYLQIVPLPSANFRRLLMCHDTSCFGITFSLPAGLHAISLGK